MKNQTVRIRKLKLIKGEPGRPYIHESGEEHIREVPCHIADILMKNSGSRQRYEILHDPRVSKPKESRIKKAEESKEEVSANDIPDLSVDSMSFTDLKAHVRADKKKYPKKQWNKIRSQNGLLEYIKTK